MFYKTKNLQKNKYILEIIQNIYNGKIYTQDKNQTAFKWTLNKKEEVLNIYYNFNKT